MGGFPPLGGAPSTSASSHRPAMRSSVDGFLPLGRAGFAILLYYCITSEVRAASMGEVILEQRLDQGRKRLRARRLHEGEEAKALGSLQGPTNHANAFSLFPTSKPTVQPYNGVQVGRALGATSPRL